LGLAYYLYAVHGILPGDFYRRGQGEKDLIWAFASYENEKRKPRTSSKAKVIPSRPVKSAGRK
jgi:hypothetical protein